MSASNLPISDPKVSVCMITYNHERFIAEAIESVLKQKTDFPVELVIGEDCSTDGTRAIVVEYAERYPDRIRPFLREQNLGMNANFVATLQACHGEHIALLEGDDYWIDPQKLQKQVDFLETHPKCSICYHNVLIQYEDNSQKPPEIFYKDPQKKFLTLEDILKGNFIHTCSVMFRNGLFGDFPEWYYKLPIGDWPLHILNAQYGKIGYIDEVMGIYRIHKSSYWSSQAVLDRIKQMIGVYNVLFCYLGTNYKREIFEGIKRQIDAYIVNVLQNSKTLTIKKIECQSNELFKELSYIFLPSKRLKRMIRGSYYSYFLFYSFKKGDFYRARRLIIPSIIYDYTLLFSLGFLVVAFKVFCGPVVESKIRRVADFVGLTTLFHRLRC